MRYTHDDWIAEGKRRFGDDLRNWKFVCPACGRTNTGKEFEDAGAGPNKPYSTCIGRHNGKGANGMANHILIPEYGCNWAAFGLLGTLGKGNIVVTEDGNEVDVFAFADTSPCDNKIRG